MAEYTIRDPKSGRTVTLRGDSPPTEQELEHVFASIGPAPDMSQMPAMAPAASHGATQPAPESIFARLGHAITGANAQQAQTLAHPEVVQGQAQVLPQLAVGAAKGGASTVYHGGDLIRRTVGMPRVINDPSVQAAITPSNPLQTAGFGGEQAAEFMLPLSKVAKGAEGASLFSRVMREAGTGAAVAGAQTGGDPAAMIEQGGFAAALPFASTALKAGREVIGRTAAGAAEGGIGGALASVARDVAPSEPKTMIVQALKPRATNTGFESALDRAMPEIKATGKPINGVDDLLEATKDAKKRIWAQYEQIAGPKRAISTTVDASPVADAIEASIPKKLRLENPDAAAKVESLANTYRQRFSIQDVEQLLKETNAELDGFYAKYPGAKRASLTANPEIAQTVAQAESLRKVLYDALDAGGETGAARELKQRYGALTSVEDEAYRRANVAKRQQPESLSEQIGKVRAAADMARGAWKLMHMDPMGAADIAAARAGRQAATYLKEQQTADALVRRAFAGYKGEPVPVPMPVQRRPAGLLGPGPIVTPPPADRSFVRGVRGEYARREVRGLLGPGEPPKPQEPPRRVFHMGGEVKPDSSKVGSVPAAPIDYAVDPTVPVKAGGFKVSQFSGDPEAAAAAVAKPEVRQMLERMRDDLDVFKPQRGMLVNGIKAKLGDDVSHYAAGGAGSAVGDDVRVISEQNVGNDKIAQAIEDLLAGKKPTNRLHTAALDAAMGYLEKRPGYRGPKVPAGLNAPAEDDGFDAFSRAVDELAE
jgi:hypothetical protein